MRLAVAVSKQGNDYVRESTGRQIALTLSLNAENVTPYQRLGFLCEGSNSLSML
jgi:hypothetical protein